MTERNNSAWSPSSREIERQGSRRAINRKQILIAAVSSFLVLGTLAIVLITSPGWQTVKATFFDIDYGKEVFPTVIIRIVDQPSTHIYGWSGNRSYCTRACTDAHN